MMDRCQLPAGGQDGNRGAGEAPSGGAVSSRVIGFLVSGSSGSNTQMRDKGEVSKGEGMDQVSLNCVCVCVWMQWLIL